MSEYDRTKWDGKYAAAEPPREPSVVLVELCDRLPTRGTALDVAGGAGRNGIWLAQRGLDVTIADVSGGGLAIARQRAAEAGVEIGTAQVDFEVVSPFAPRKDVLSRSERPPTWDLIVSVCYLWRPMFAVYPTLLAPGGLLIVIQPTLKNLERHDKPPADFLLEPGELPKLVRPLEVLYYHEGWQADDRHDAVLIAQNTPFNKSGGN